MCEDCTQWCDFKVPNAESIQFGFIDMIEQKCDITLPDYSKRAENRCAFKSSLSTEVTDSDEEFGPWKQSS